MAQRRSILNTPPQAPKVDLPQEGPQTWLDPVLEALTTGLGLESQKPGSLPGAIGASAQLLPLWMVPKIFRRAVPANAPQLAKDIEAEMEAFRRRPVPGSMAEFEPVTTGTRPPLSVIEEEKALQLTKPPEVTPPKVKMKKPRDPRASGMVPGENPADRTKQVIPEFRSPYGRSLDVTNDIKKSGQTEDFARFTLGGHDPNLEDVANFDPLDTVADVWAIDTGPSSWLDEAGRQVERTSPAVDAMTQDLADYFASPKFDPFGTGSHPPPDYNLLNNLSVEESEPFGSWLESMGFNLDDIMKETPQMKKYLVDLFRGSSGK